MPGQEPRKVLFSQKEAPNAEPPWVSMKREDSAPVAVKWPRYSKLPVWYP